MKEPLKPILKQASKFIGQEDVDQILVYLGLLDNNDLASSDDGGPASQVPPLPMLSPGKVRGVRVNNKEWLIGLELWE